VVVAAGQPLLVAQQTNQQVLVLVVLALLVP
jgi:hypothetical protein